jgi:peptidyl-dipeptidase A
MANEIDSFIASTVEGARPREKAWTLSDWDMAASGTEEANTRNEEAQTAYMRYWADPELYAKAERLRKTREKDPVRARQLELIHLSCARNRQDEDTIRELTRLEAEVRGQYYNYRGIVAGRELDDNGLESILNKSHDRDEVRDAWTASKEVGARVADTVRELARVRNRAARAQGFRDHFQRSLAMDEIDETRLLSLFEELEAKTRAPFAKLKARIDALRASRFGIAEADLMPWHYGDRFFQEVPPLGEFDFDGLFEGKDLVALANATYDGLGMDVRDIIARSDLYPRQGKNQHAFCTHIDREGDIRTLNNLIPNQRWTETILHELGHAVYEKYLGSDLPWLLRTPSHTLTTEAVAIIMGGLTSDTEWLTKVMGIPGGKADQASGAARDIKKATCLIFTRWCLVMTNFERALYEDPDRDLDTMWWDLAERYQLLKRPNGRRSPDWAAKIHIALAPVYYQNYEIGHLVKEQFLDRLRKSAGGLVGRPDAGKWLIEHVFKPGARQDWVGHVESATSEPLNHRYFVESVGG